MPIIIPNTQATPFQICFSLFSYHSILYRLYQHILAVKSSPADDRTYPMAQGYLSPRQASPDSMPMSHRACPSSCTGGRTLWPQELPDRISLGLCPQPSSIPSFSASPYGPHPSGHSQPCILLQAANTRPQSVFFSFSQECRLHNLHSALVDQRISPGKLHSFLWLYPF